MAPRVHVADGASLSVNHYINSLDCTCKFIYSKAWRFDKINDSPIVREDWMYLQRAIINLKVEIFIEASVMESRPWTG